MKIYHIKGFGTKSTCKEIKANLKTMSFALCTLGLTLTTLHELTNTAYLIDIMSRSESGKLILMNPELTKLFLESPVVKGWISDPDMIANLNKIISEIARTAFSAIGM